MPIPRVAARCAAAVASRGHRKGHRSRPSRLEPLTCLEGARRRHARPAQRQGLRSQDQPRDAPKGSPGRPVSRKACQGRGADFCRLAVLMESSEGDAVAQGDVRHGARQRISTIIWAQRNNAALIGGTPANAHTATMKSFGNFGNVEVVDVRNLNPVSVLSAKKV